MKPVIAILGGSTPFTAALVEALRAAADIPTSELRLFGQDIAALERMKWYADRRLGPIGWNAWATPRLDEAVDGAEVVVNQIRFGGLAGRARDEALANRFQLPADETLGPCGLASALRVIPPLAALAAQLGRQCPNAWLLNLANPLSATTAAMIRAGAPRKCVGLCELPLSTVMETCRLLEMSLADVDWRYAGLNHRGFVFVLKHRGEDLLPRLPEMLGGRSIFGVSGEDIRRVGALPLKYFRLSAFPTRAAASHRADFLINLKETIARELQALPRPPPSLSLRDFRWYEGAVVPMLAAIFADDRRQLMVNYMREDDLVWEGPARVLRDGVEAIPTEPTAEVVAWLDRWAAHERALLEAVATPTLDRIEQALALDPSVPQSRLREIGRAVWSEYERN